MDPNNIVRCDECINYNYSFNDCKVKTFEKIDNASCCINCEKYSPSVKKLFGELIEGIGVFKLIDFLAGKLNKAINFFTKRG